MAEIIRPAVLNERFTTIDACGIQTQLSLSEMTAEEVIDAALWLMAEFERLDRLSVLHGRHLSLEAAAEEVMHRHLHLMNRLYVARPQWRQYREMNWHEALRRYWPHGRAA